MGSSEGGPQLTAPIGMQGTRDGGTRTEEVVDLGQLGR